MNAGDIIRLKRFETFYPDGRSSSTWVAKTRKGETAKVFLCVVLAMENLKLGPDDKAIGVEGCLRALGYQPIPSPPPRARPRGPEEIFKRKRSSAAKRGER